MDALEFLLDPFIFGCNLSCALAVGWAATFFKRNFFGWTLLAGLLLPLAHLADAFAGLWALAFLYLNGMSITGGYHRLWAHKSYQAHPALRVFFALWGAREFSPCGAQGSFRPAGRKGPTLSLGSGAAWWPTPTLGE